LIVTALTAARRSDKDDATNAVKGAPGRLRMR
jgi:hypothetical protein